MASSKPLSENGAQFGDACDAHMRRSLLPAAQKTDGLSLTHHHNATYRSLTPP